LLKGEKKEWNLKILNLHLGGDTLKGKELIKIIKENNLELFDIEVGFIDGYDDFPNWRIFSIESFDDINYISEVAKFSIEEKE